MFDGVRSWLQKTSNAPRISNLFVTFSEGVCAKYALLQMEICRNGRRITLGKRVYCNKYRGFESLSLRHITSGDVVGRVYNEEAWRADHRRILCFGRSRNKIPLSPRTSQATQLTLHEKHEKKSNHIIYHPNLTNS